MKVVEKFISINGEGRRSRRIGGVYQIQGL